MKKSARNLYFSGREMVEVRVELLPDLAPGQVMVKTEYTAISAGTELLIYRDLFPRQLSVDEAISPLAGEFQYPLRYGYAAVGVIITAGPEVDKSWIGKRVFAFHPHADHFITDTANLIPVPEDISADTAAFLPNMETAINFVMDGGPLIGEQVCVFGQGIVGLLTTSLLARFPLSRLVAVDRYPQRREAALLAGADACFDAASPAIESDLARQLPGGADLQFELSGSPEALNLALAAAGFSSRIIIGSWYGQKLASLDLGGKFHRSRIQLISSQVTTIAPAISGRWSKQRRFELAWEMLRRVQPQRWISHRFDIDQADQAYHLLDKNPQETIQVLFQYGN